MSLEKKFNKAETSFLQGRKDVLEYKKNSGKKILNPTEEKELAIIERILKKRLDAEMQSVREKIANNLEKDIQSENEQKLEGDESREKKQELTFNQIKEIYISGFENIQKKSASVSLLSDERKVLAGAKLIGDGFKNWKYIEGNNKVDRRLNEVVVLSPTNDYSKNTRGAADAAYGTGFIHTSDITEEWAGICFTKQMLYFNGFTQMVSLTSRQTGLSSLQVTQDQQEMQRINFESENFSRVGAYAALQVLSDGRLQWPLKEIREHNGFHTPKDIINFLIQNPEEWMKIVKELNRYITRKSPKSLQEAITRYDLFWIALAHNLPKNNGKFDADFIKKFESQTFEMAKIEMERVPVIIPFTSILELLSISSDSLLSDEAMLSQFIFVRSGNDIHFLCPDSLQGQISAGSFKPIADVEKFDLIGALEIDDTQNWAAGTFESIDKLEAQLFKNENVEGKFLDEEADDEGSQKEKNKTGGTCGIPPIKKQSLPRLRSLRNILLRNKIPAVFTRDGGMEDLRQDSFVEVEPGHYMIVTLSDLEMQIIISDDYEKPAYVVYNKIDPTTYTEIHLNELSDQFGGTSVRWNTKEQWQRSIENTIHQQTENRIKVYPVNSEYPSPLDKFPDSESLSALKIDFEAAAKHAGKSQEPHLLKAGDFEQINSGAQLWSFGGNAHGGIYLDRLAREFGLRGTDLGENQYVFRRTILKVLLYEIFPEYREMHERKDKIQQQNGD